MLAMGHHATLLSKQERSLSQGVWTCRGRQCGLWAELHVGARTYNSYASNSNHSLTGTWWLLCVV